MENENSRFIMKLIDFDRELKQIKKRFGDDMNEESFTDYAMLFCLRDLTWQLEQTNLMMNEMIGIMDEMRLKNDE